MTAMIDTAPLADLLNNFRQSTEEVLDTASVNACENLEAQLSEIDGYVREMQQAMWASEAFMTIQHLQEGTPLTENDKQVIRTFLVSDAEHYLANENNFPDWIAEMKRLARELENRSQNVTRESIGELRGILKDAMRVLPDIRNYLDEQRRVSRFDLAVDEIDEPTRNMMIKIIREQLQSPAR